MSPDGTLDLFGEVDAPAGGAEQDPPADRPEASAARPGPGAPAGAPSEPEPRVWSVSQVNRAVRSLLETTVEPLWVGGEVANWTRARSGHRYFTLKDDRAQIRCVLWERHARALPADPEEGMQLRVHGTLTLYEGRGEYQLSADRIEAEGPDGLWRRAFEKLRAALEREGALDPARKRRLPRFPGCVGVVTSPTGAAVRDVISVLRRRAPWVRVLVCGTRVQGEGASAQVARALERIGACGLCDVVIVARGGGSLEDLWAFNEEPVARAILACPVPVVSAVGHEVDVTIADLVADLRAPTPSGGAEAVAPDADDLLRSLRALPERLGRGLRACTVRRRLALRGGSDRLVRAVERRLAPLRQRTDRAAEDLERAMRRLLERRRARLDRTGAGDLGRALGRVAATRRATLGALSGRLDALSPLAVLQRGYAVPLDPDGHVLRELEDFTPDRAFRLRVHGGEVPARVDGPPRPGASGGGG